MKVSVDEDRCFIIEEVYSNFVMRTEEGNEIAICMRDDTFEINVLPNKNIEGNKDVGEHNWYRVDMQQGTVYNRKEYCEEGLKNES
jgi:hypothetical protein